MVRRKNSASGIVSCLFFIVSNFLIQSDAADEYDVVTLPVLQDTRIVDGSGTIGAARRDDNYGGDSRLLVGNGVRTGTFRTLLSFFDGSNTALTLRMTSKAPALLENAFLQLTVAESFDGHTPCISTDSDDTRVGCPTVHSLTQTWGEGQGSNSDAVEGESSWIHYSWPDQWSTPGGDHNTTPVGELVSAGFLATNDIATFPLDVPSIRSILDVPTTHFGFLLKDDMNPGGLGFFSRENTEEQPAPQLVLEFLAPTVVSLDAIRDTRITDGSGRDDDNFGIAPLLLLGRGTTGIFRSLLYFDVAQVMQQTPSSSTLDDLLEWFSLWTASLMDMFRVLRRELRLVVLRFISLRKSGAKDPEATEML